MGSMYSLAETALHFFAGDLGGLSLRLGYVSQDESICLRFTN